MNKEEIFKMKEFDEKQLSKLISDLRDINSYTSFKNGAYIYDLGKYQGSLLINYIEQLQNNWNELKKYVQEELKEAEDDFAQEDFIKVLDRMQELEGNNENTEN